MLRTSSYPSRTSWMIRSCRRCFCRALLIIPLRGRCSDCSHSVICWKLRSSHLTSKNWAFGMTSTSHCKAGSSSWHQEREQPSNSSPINLQVVSKGFRLAAKANRILATASRTANVGSCQRLCKTSSRTKSSDQNPWLMMRLCQPMMVCSSFWCCRPVNCGQTPELYMSFEQTNASRSCNLVGIEIRLLAKRGLASCLKVVVAVPMRLLISPPKCKPWPKQVPRWTYLPN